MSCAVESPNGKLCKSCPSLLIQLNLKMDLATFVQDGSGQVARFAGPSGMDISSDGSTILVADSSNNYVRRITLS